MAVKFEPPPIPDSINVWIAIQNWEVGNGYMGVDEALKELSHSYAKTAIEPYAKRIEELEAELAKNASFFDECSKLDRVDAERFRWLTEDHTDAETRTRCREILDRMAVLSYSAACDAIDRARRIKKGSE